MSHAEAKLICKIFVDTIQQETETTKKVMRAIPEDKKSYKPEAKSMSAHELAWHIATSEVWFLDSVLAGQFTMTDEQLAAPPTISAIVSWYETNHRDRLNKVKALAVDKSVKPAPLLRMMEIGRASC